MKVRAWLAVVAFGFSISSVAQTSGNIKPVKHKKSTKINSDDVIDSTPTPRSPSTVVPGSERQHQAAAEKFEISIGSAYGSGKSNINDPSSPTLTSSQTTVAVTGVQGEYGFNDQISAGLTLEYDATWTNFSPTDSVPNSHGFGMVDPKLFIKARTDFESSSLRYGANLAISLGKLYQGSNGNRNFYSGGPSLEPFVGYEYYLGDHTMGVRAQYKFYLGSRSGTLVLSGNDLSVDITGGNVLTLAPFYEYNLLPMKIGVDFTLISTGPVSLSAPNTTFSNQGSTTNYNFDVYAPILLGDSFTLIPKGTFGWEGSNGTTTSANLWSAELTARYAF